MWVQTGRTYTGPEQGPQLAHEVVPSVRTDYLLRRLLAIRIAGPLGYFDDGELQDNSRLPHIDFLRDSPKDIELKLAERAARVEPNLTSRGKTRMPD